MINLGFKAWTSFQPGAEVIKIERTNTGDPTRNQLLDVQDSWSLYYLQLINGA